ncbi:MAG: hypothetical protein GC145_13065 [Caulobacter sp.]|nr:hypothetical protein [Caulobacter sp.]
MSTNSRNHLGPITTIDDLDLFTKSGVVIDRQAESDTRVYGSVTNGHGRVSSSTTDYLTLFLRKDDGDELSIVLQDFTVQARVGNRVSIIFASDKNSGSGWAAGFLNHDTRQEVIRTATIESLAPIPKSGCALLILVPVGAFMVLGTVARAALGFGGDQSAIALLLVLAWLASPFVAFGIMLTRGRRLTREAKHLQAQVRAAIQQQIDATRSATPSAE